MLTTNFEESREILDFELIKEDEALIGFITDYLSKRGFNDTVQELYKENNKIKLIPKDQVKYLINSINQIRGNLHKNESVLFEWWKVFWNILKENKQKQSVSSGMIGTSDVTKKAEGLKRSFNESNDKSIKIIIEEGINTRSTSNTSSTSSTSTSSSTIGEHPYKKLKKKSIISSIESLNTLDISSLTGIEKSLLSTNLMNKNLTKLTAEEGKRIEAALMNNKVSKESWEMYLIVCKEYQKMPQVLKNPKINYCSPNPDFINGVVNNSNYLGIIDQVNQPIDSRQLLLLRQSLYQEYLKKQSQSFNYTTNYPIYNREASTSATGSVVNTNSVNSASTSSHKSPVISTSTNGTANTINTTNTANTINTTSTSSASNTTSTTDTSSNVALNASSSYFDENIFGPFEIKDELNFNDFMNEYLI